MSYPPPPGLKTSQPTAASSTPQPHPSLPARPPPPAAPLPSFKPAFSGNSSGAAGALGTRGSGNHGGFTAFKPRSVGGTAASSGSGTPNWSNYTPTVSAEPAPPSGFSAPQTGAYQQPQFQQSQYQQPQAYYQQNATEHYAQPTGPQIRNPFPLPSQEQDGGFGRGKGGLGRDRLGDGTFDPELEAQIAQWQSAYMPKDESAAFSKGSRDTGSGGGGSNNANYTPLGQRSATAVPSGITNIEVSTSVKPESSSVAAVVSGADGKQKTVVRSGGGQTWQDSSLLEWDPAHFRLFVGNLAGEVTDESLLKAFAKYPSVQKARVVRDKRTTKSKGYGFVSFSDGDEYFQAAKEMQGKYIGSHPVLLRRSTTEIRPTNPVDKRKGGKGGKGGGGIGANTGAGVQKKQTKTKGGLRILG